MSVKLSPLFNDQSFDASGDPAVGYKLFTYAAGSTTKQTTYTDSAGLVPQSNPIILNSSGYPTNGPIWLTAGLSYKLVLALPTDTDPPSSPVKTIDGITGVNDSSTTATQWVSSGITPTYISSTSFSMPGDQTTEFHVGRRVQATTSGGTVYGVIATSAYSSLTTITLTMDSGSLDAGLSVINLSFLRNDHSAIPASVASNASASVQIQSATRFTAGGTSDAITGTLSPAITAYAAGLRITSTVAANTIAAPTLNLNSLGAKTIKKRDINGSLVSLDAGDYNASGPADFEYDGTYFVLLNPPAIVTSTIRQTVLSGPVDSSGFSAFGGATGSTTVTATGTLKVTAAAGGDTNYTRSITNPSWTGLSTNGTMYLYLDITSAGVVSTGSTTLAPVYQWGGTYSTTNNQNTFNIQEMTMKVGNGSVATQVYRVFIGEVTVSGGVVTVITWYALMGRYFVEQSTLAASTAYSFNHNIGTNQIEVTGWFELKNAVNGFSVGDRIDYTYGDSNGTQQNGAPIWYTAKQCGATMGTGGPQFPNKSTGAVGSVAITDVKLGMYLKRGW